jgi:hypothetical protein
VITTVAIILIRDWAQLSGMLCVDLIAAIGGLAWSMYDTLEEIHAGRAQVDRFAEKTIYRFAMTIFLIATGIDYMLRHRS